MQIEVRMRLAAIFVQFSVETSLFICSVHNIVYRAYCRVPYEFRGSAALCAIATYKLTGGQGSRLPMDMPVHAQERGYNGRGLR